MIINRCPKCGSWDVVYIRSKKVFLPDIPVIRLQQKIICKKCKYNVSLTNSYNSEIFGRYDDYVYQLEEMSFESIEKEWERMGNYNDRT